MKLFIQVIDGKGVFKKVKDIESEAIVLALYRTKGNRSQAGRALGISERNMKYKIAAIRKRSNWVVPCSCWFDMRGTRNKCAGFHPEDSSSEDHLEVQEE